MGALIAILSELLGIGASIGIPYAIEWIQSNRVHSEGKDPAILIADIDKLMSEPKIKANSRYNQIVSKLNAIPDIYSSPAVTDKLRTLKKKLNDKKLQLEKTVNDIETSHQKLINRANTYAALPDSVKNTEVGSKMHKDIKNELMGLHSEYERRITDNGE